MEELLSASASGDSPNGRHPATLPHAGSLGEHILQQQYGTTERADRFYDNQLSDELTPRMTEFIGRMEMAFIATSDASGECDCSFRAGEAGFIRVLDERTIAYPEFRGNGVMASLGNIVENQHVGILMIDFTQDLIGLHVNGAAEIVTPACLHALDEHLPEPTDNPGKRPVQWVLVRITEAYIHCSKHIPKLVPQPRIRHWGTDNPRHKGGDYFGVAARNLESQRDRTGPAGPITAVAAVAAESPAESPAALPAARSLADAASQADLPSTARVGTFML
jgi:uncharacterized protein